MESKSGGKTAIYSVGTKETGLVLWRNSHDFAASDAPQVGEKFVLLFTEPWMAYLFIREEMGEVPEIGIYRIDSQTMWDYYRGLAMEAHGAERSVINKCMSKNAHAADRLFPVRKLNADHANFDKLVADAAKISACPVCYDQGKVPSGDSVPVFATSFDETELPQEQDESAQDPDKAGRDGAASFLGKLVEFLLILPFAFGAAAFIFGATGDGQIALFMSPGVIWIYYARGFISEALSSKDRSPSNLMASVLGIFFGGVFVSVLLGFMLWEGLGGNYCEGWAKSERLCTIEWLSTSIDEHDLWEPLGDGRCNSCDLDDVLKSCLSQC